MTLREGFDYLDSRYKKSNASSLVRPLPCGSSRAECRFVRGSLVKGEGRGVDLEPAALPGAASKAGKKWRKFHRAVKKEEKNISRIGRGDKKEGGRGLGGGRAKDVRLWGGGEKIERLPPSAAAPFIKTETL